MNGFAIKTIGTAISVLALGGSSHAEKLVLVHTNDTHSQIYVSDKGLGGIERRKVLVDSIRSVHPDMLLIDAGDAVQGTLFFTLYRGEVELKMMNELGDYYAILGNHDFDNGVEALADNPANSSVLEPYFRPYALREIGGKKVGIIGLNLNPDRRPRMVARS